MVPIALFLLRQLLCGVAVAKRICTIVEVREMSSFAEEISVTDLKPSGSNYLA